MIVFSIGDIIAWALGGIGLAVVIIVYIIDRFQKRREKKIEIAIGKYDEKLNKTNRTFLVGKGLKGQHANMVILDDLDHMLSEKVLEHKIKDMERKDD